jgi:hypothetical protein
MNRRTFVTQTGTFLAAAGAGNAPVDQYFFVAIERSTSKEGANIPS